MKESLMKIKSYNVAALLVIATLLVAPVSGSGATGLFGSKKKAAAAKSNSTDSVKKVTPYQKLFKDKTVKTVKGLMTLHLVDEKLYTEIPIDLLGREMIIGTTIEESSVFFYGLSGQQPLEPYHVTIVKSDSLIQMREVSRRVLTDGDKNIERSLDKNLLDPIVASYAIKAYNDDSTAVVIDNSALFAKDNEKLRPFYYEGLGQLYISIPTFKPELSFLSDVRAGKDYVSIISEMSYTVNTSFFGLAMIYRDKPFSVVANRTIMLLPEEMARERIADPRLGVQPVPYRKFTTDRGSKVEYFSARVNIEKQGELQPITFYIDTLFSPTWVKAIERSVAMWNNAFERIGYKDVLRTSMYPRSADFDSNSPGRFYIQYVATSNTTTTVNTWTDPRTGEIMGARIHVPVNIVDGIRSRKFIDLAAVDSQSQSMSVSDKDICTVLQTMVARGVGQALGLATNYASAAAFPTDSLRSASFTQQNGLSSSITSPNTYNYIAQREDVANGVVLINDRLGPYDYFAIKWLYGKIDGAQTPEQERKTLSRMLSEKAADPVYYYGNFWYDYYYGDARLAYYNLGDDPFKRAEYRLRNLKYIADNADGWIKGSDDDLTYRKEIIGNLENGVKEMLYYMMGYVGSVYYQEVMADDGQTMLKVVPKETQRRALFEALKTVENLPWLDNKDLSRDMLIGSMSESVQSSVMMVLLNKLGSLQRNQMRLPGAYTAEEMSNDLVGYMFRNVKAGKKLTESDKKLQMGFVNIAISQAKVITKPASGSRSFVGQDPQIDGISEAAALQMTLGLPALSPATAPVTEPVYAYNNYLRRYVVPESTEHIYFGTLIEIRDTYKRGIQTAPDAQSRDFCKYMFDRIEQSLSIK